MGHKMPYISLPFFFWEPFSWLRLFLAIEVGFEGAF
jgi:hypothetical protein